MPEKEVWCLAGLPCTGKSTLAKGLEEDFGYKHLDRDIFWETIAKQGKELFTEIIRRFGMKPTLEQIKSILPLAKPVIENFKLYADTLSTNLKLFTDNLPAAGLHTLKTCELFQQADDFKILLEILGNPNVAGSITFGVANLKALTESTQEKKSIVDSFDFSIGFMRTMALRFLRLQEIQPGLIIVQNTRARIRELIERRQTETSKPGEFIHQENHIEGFAMMSNPYDPQFEEWSKILILDLSVDRTTSEIRDALLAASTLQEDHPPIPFLI